MITRHMRTHARYEAQRAAAAAAVAASNGAVGMDVAQTAAANFQRNLMGKSLLYIIYRTLCPSLLQLHKSLCAHNAACKEKLSQKCLF